LLSTGSAAVALPSPERWPARGVIGIASAPPLSPAGGPRRTGKTPVSAIAIARALPQQANRSSVPRELSFERMAHSEAGCRCARDEGWIRSRGPTRWARSAAGDVAGTRSRLEVGSPSTPSAGRRGCGSRSIPLSLRWRGVERLANFRPRPRNISFYERQRCAGTRRQV
jgi:hypothetical protein